MKMKTALYCVMIALVMGVTGCGGGNKELKKDAKDFADAMCKSIETTQKLRAANPADSVLLKKLQMEQHNIGVEMTILYQEFKKKYGDKAKTPEFNKEYRKYLSESMLDCECLSKEDRENFAKEVK